jgi:glycosyltransferase involved in cell wall biosynthesis
LAQELVGLSAVGLTNIKVKSKLAHATTGFRLLKYLPDELRLTFAVPGDLATPTGGYVYDQRIIRGLRQLGWQVDVADIGDAFPFPDRKQRAAALARLSAAPAGYPIVVDGLAFGALPEIAALQSRTPLVALVHQPLALDPALSSTQATILRETERAALAHAAHVIVTSETTARIVVSEYGIPSQLVSVVRPGTDLVPPARGSGKDFVQLLSVGSIVPVKGYDILIAALAMLADLPWRLTIAGDKKRNPAAATQVKADIAAYNLRDRITLLGAVGPERILELYSAADMFVLASRFESYGMALADAIAHGLPIVSTKAGAIPKTLPVGTRLLVPPGDIPALAQALHCMIVGPRERQRLAANARMAAMQLPTWTKAARQFAGAIEVLSNSLVGPTRAVANVGG